MSTMTVPAERLDLARAAAKAALAVLPASRPLLVGDPSELPQAPLAGQAVTARFSGAATGEVVVVVAQDLADALRNSPLGELDLAKAVGPALDAAAGAFGPVVVDPGQALDPHVALESLGAKGDPVYVPLVDDDETVASVAIVLTPWPDPQPSAAAAAVPQAAQPASSRGGLDLLHDVEMEVSAELGRTQMSVRELLQLAPGAVVELDRAAGSPSDLLVNGRLIARGEVVVIDENFGIRITEIVPPGGERS
ncbi:MAG TPA: flagellar motor switch protein FliN [Rugosimonospora sp.]|nr:flagellar motor switch protein FliN [Rugosimonospora sp.]